MPPPEAPKGTQPRLPFFPDGSVMLGKWIGVTNREGAVWYFNGSAPMFTHGVEDRKSFRAYTSQLCETGLCKQADVVRAFGVTKESVMRGVALYRHGGMGAFFESRQPARKPRVMTPEKIAEAQALLDEGLSPRIISVRLGVKADTIRDNIDRGRLHRKKKT